MTDVSVETKPTELRILSILFAVAAVTYLLWWFPVEWLLPGSFNPLAGRLAVVALFGGGWVAARAGRFSPDALRVYFGACAWILTAHYFYLFQGNRGQLDWIIGAYITVMAISQTFLTLRALLAYSLYVALLGGAMLAILPPLRQSVFLAGLMTVLALVYIGARTRERLIGELARKTEGLRMRDEFIAIASHELKTPLTSMKMQILLAWRTLSAEPADGRRVEDSLLRIDQQTNRMIRLVEDMLASSPVASGRLTLRLERLGLGSIVRECFALLANPIIALEAPEGVFVSGDAYRLEQVVLNLLENAIKYGQGNPVDARLASDGAFAVLEVTDRGIGISPDSLARIFEKYERAVSIENISGLGLGLYISRAVVEQHGGAIEVRSRLGEGSVFTVRLPLER
jgi:signal transduction histidine kinase